MFSWCADILSRKAAANSSKTSVISSMVLRDAHYFRQRLRAVLKNSLSAYLANAGETFDEEGPDVDGLVESILYAFAALLATLCQLHATKDQRRKHRKPRRANVEPISSGYPASLYRLCLT